jgi:hypothetical protein
MLVLATALAALAVAILAPAAVSDNAPKTARTDAGTPVTLTVSINGEGWVESTPAGINCGSVCSAQFPSGTVVDLAALPVTGSAFGGWSATPPYVCIEITIKDPAACELTLDDAVGVTASVQATFQSRPGPPPCLVPRVEGKTLARAKALLAEHDCRVGTVRYAFSLRRQRHRVISQNPRAGWRREAGAKVNLVVGLGRR